MRAIQVSEFGGPEVLVAGDADDPVAGAGEVLIEVAAADVIFLDATIRSGDATEYFPVRPPYVPGGGVGGRVASVGPGVPEEWLGWTVVARTGGPGGGGGYAELAVAAVGSARHADAAGDAAADGELGGRELAVVPDGVDLGEATALVHDGATALRLLATTGVRPGETALVLGAAGGLGALLVQLALADGARVIGAARGAAKLARIRELGAAAVDYSSPGWTARVTELTGAAGPDVVFDGVGGTLAAAAFQIVADGGRFSAHGSPSGGFAAIDPAQARRRGVRVRGIEQVAFETGAHLAFLKRALAELTAGRITPVIGGRFPLEQAAQAHAAIEARIVVGKSLLTVRAV